MKNSHDKCIESHNSIHLVEKTHPKNNEFESKYGLKLVGKTNPKIYTFPCFNIP